MKKIIKIYLLMVLVAVSGCATRYHKGNYHYSNMAFHKAAEKYSRYLKHHDKPQVMLRLAATYDKMHDYEAAEYWYGRAITQPEAKPADQLAYARVLKINGKYDQAKLWFGKYLESVPDDAMVRGQLQSCDMIGEYNRNADQYRADLLPIQNNENVFGMTPFEGGYVFCAEQAVSRKQKTNPWNGRSYQNLMFTKQSSDGSFTNPLPFDGAFNCPYHNGPVAFTGNFDKIFFSRSNYFDNRRFKNADNVNTIKIYSARRKDGEWKDIMGLPFSSKNYSCAHPALTPGGDTMFFASDMPGGYGMADIYMSTLAAGRWTEPKNLGPAINTGGNEMFPSYHRDAAGNPRLYFSSDGLPGMGGLDLFYSSQRSDGSWDGPVHMTVPFNSSKDDFGIVFSGDENSGFFSSSRQGNVDKLFAFNKVVKFIVDGSVYNKETNQLIAGATVQVANKTAGTAEILLTNENGGFTTPLEKNSDYLFTAGKDKFVSGMAVASTAGKTSSETMYVKIYLEPVIEVPAKEDIFLGERPVVYFDFDKFNIRPDAKVVLDKIYEHMTDNPNERIAIGAHADCRGTDNYNMILSRKRAMSVAAYLTGKGISRNRFELNWYGERKPINECVDGVTCEPAKHQKNRRAEFMNQ